jgi:hypothetical protein
MIFVKKNTDDSSQKVISTFVKRVKKSNLVSRKRKIEFLVKPHSQLRKKRKALQRQAYQAKKSLQEKLSNV